MKYAVFLLALSALAFASSFPESIDDGHHHGPAAYMPSQCPFVNTNSGFRCLGIPIPNGYYVGGQKYRCSNGHTWVVSSR